MKKIIASLIILMLMVTSCGLVFAEPETDDGTGTTSGTDTETGTGEDGNEEETPTPNVTLNMTKELETTIDATSITIKLGIGTVQGLEGGALISFKGILQYDPTIFTEVTVEGLNGYTATYAPETQRIIVDPKEAVEATEIASITLTLAEGVEPCTTSITFQTEEFTDGTNDILPIIFLLSSSCFLSYFILIGSSVEYITFNFCIPISFNFFLIILANGQTFVLYISVTSNFVGSNLFPVPIQEIIGILLLSALTIKSILDDIVSIASTI